MINIYWKTGMIAEAINAVIGEVIKFAKLVSFSENNIIIRGADTEVNQYARSIPRIRGMFDAGTMNNYLHRHHPNDIGLFLVDEQLCDETGSYLLGLARGFSITISLGSVKNPSSLAELAMHELGHAHGMTYYGRPDTEQRGGSHCTKPGCLMQQTYGIDAFERHVLESRRCGWFCETCIAGARTSNERKGWYQVPSLPPRRNLPPRKRSATNLPVKASDG